MLDFVKRLFGRRKETERDQDALRAEFQSRYHHFRLLLDNDRSGHECLADIEEALQGETVFGMRFVRRSVTNATTSAFQMALHLTALAPGKYDRLLERIKVINANITAHLAEKCRPGDGPLSMDLSEVGLEHADLAGPKMAGLGEAGRRLGIRVQPGFVITAEACRRFMEHQGLRQEILRRIQAADMDNESALFQLASSLQQLVHDAELPPGLPEIILDRFERLAEATGATHVAVRSSALGEDLAGACFAGQYKSLLNVGREELILAYKSVMASKYGAQAMTYRLNRGFRDEDMAMCVGVTAMVDALAGGVAYSSGAVDPMDRDISIYSAWGLPKTVVNGSSGADLFRVDRNEPLKVVSKVVADKEILYISREDEGTVRVETPESKRQAPSITDKQAVEVARMALRLEKHFGSPQDVEWAVDREGGIILLQSRSLMRPLNPVDAGEEDGPLPEPLITGGVTASPGAASGTVHLARTQADLLLFPRGGVLVVKQALPSWAPILSRASAMVAEMGTAAGHLANVAREFDVPAIFGLRNAKSILKQGETVTVDADRRSVFPGKVEALTARRPVSLSPMKGSPVHATLSAAARHILPLHLLDPDSPDFRPRNCESLHDVIRFCHEKAVKEMFSFGRDAHFPQAAAKRLHSGGAKQFWVLNLDDGFQGEVKGANVDLDQIASIPMLALWEGMNALPWEGPPAVNARGLMSVMFEATANPALDPAMASHFAARNYFMISKNYVSLQSRFGFHFCGAEALVGERDTENYAGFQFQGGAANEKRRVLRARLVAELLEERDFRVRVRLDAVTARVEGFARSRMEARLRALGHLIIHTRQLDMIMADQAEADHRKKRLGREMDRLMAGESLLDDPEGKA